MQRRSFMATLLAACAAPAIVKASSLMPIYVPKLILPPSMILPEDALCLYDSFGTLLASIPLVVAGTGYHGGVDYRGSAKVLRGGVAASAVAKVRGYDRVDLPVNTRYGSGLFISSPQLYEECNVNITGLTMGCSNI